MKYSVITENTATVLHSPQQSKHGFVSLRMCSDVDPTHSYYSEMEYVLEYYILSMSNVINMDTQVLLFCVFFSHKNLVFVSESISEICSYNKRNKSKAASSFKRRTGSKFDLCKYTHRPLY